MAPSIFPIIEPHGAGLNHDGAIKKDGKRLSTADCRGRIPSIQASRLRTMIQECWREPTKILATAAADDSLTARLVEQAGFPVIFLGGFAVASSFGLPDTVCLAPRHHIYVYRERERQRGTCHVNAEGQRHVTGLYRLPRNGHADPGRLTFRVHPNHCGR